MGKVIVSGASRASEPITFVVPLNDNEWKAISKASQKGVASNYWAVGDTKTIIINGTVGITTFSNLEIDVFILGFNHNSTIEGNNTIHFGLGKIGSKDVALCDGYYSQYEKPNITGAFSINTGNDASGGWAVCHMRKTILGSDSDPLSPTANTLLAALPSDLRVVMKPITKYSDNTGTHSSSSTGVAADVTATTDYLPLLAEFEVTGGASVANRYEKNSQAQYAYYSAGNSKIKYKHSSTGTAVFWLLRSASYSSSMGWATVNTSGRATQYNPDAVHGVSPLFMV